MAFPCNQFMNQEPGTNAEIKKKVHEKYGITFDMMSKIEVSHMKMSRREEGKFWTLLFINLE